jgi:hypothetical protein
VGEASREAAVTEANQDCGCPAPAPAAAGEYVYAIGTVAPRAPSLSIEKELMQAVGRLDDKGRTDRQTLQSALSSPENRYLARQMCWVFSVQRIETYILGPRDPADYSLLIDALRTEPSATDLDVVIGVRGPVAPPGACGGLQLPIVAFDQLYSFDHASFVGSIPTPEGRDAKSFAPVADELFDRILQLGDNAGATDEHRALNYLSMRYPAIYARTAEAFEKGAALSSVEARPSALAGARRIVEVVFSYRDRTTDVVEKSVVRVDVTEEFPFLVSKLSPYYDH